MLEKHQPAYSQREPQWELASLRVLPFKHFDAKNAKTWKISLGRGRWTIHYCNIERDGSGHRWQVFNSREIHWDVSVLWRILLFGSLWCSLDGVFLCIVVFLAHLGMWLVRLRHHPRCWCVMRDSEGLIRLTAWCTGRLMLPLLQRMCSLWLSLEEFDLKYPGLHIAKHSFRPPCTLAEPDEFDLEDFLAWTLTLTGCCICSPRLWD